MNVRISYLDDVNIQKSLNSEFHNKGHMRSFEVKDNMNKVT